MQILAPAACDVGLVFFSKRAHDAKWFREEVSVLVHEMIEKGRRLIPVMIDAVSHLVTLGEMAVSPGMQALGANMAPPGEKGRYLGVQGVFQQVGSSAGILVGSNAIGLISPWFQQGPWFIVAAVAVVSALGFLSLGRRLTPEQDGLRNPEAPASPVEAPATV